MDLTTIRTLYPRFQTLSDSDLSIWLEAGKGYVTAYYGRDFTPGLKTDRFSSMNDTILFLRNPPVISVKRIRIDCRPWCNCEHDVRWARDGRLFMGGTTFWNQLSQWPAGVNSIEVEYLSEGLSAAVQATLYGAVMSWQYEGAQQNIAANSERIGDYFYMNQGNGATGTSQAPPHFIQKLFAPYVRRLAC